MSILFAGLFWLISACSQSPQLPSNKVPPDDENEKLIVLNKAIVHTETDQIQAYIRQHHLTTVKSPYGFWYVVLKEGKGSIPQNDDVVAYQYAMSLLDGTACYSNLRTHQISRLRVGHTTMIRGVELGLMTMKPGGESLFIIPSNLAYSVLGDRHLIPPYSPLVVSLKLIDIEPVKNTKNSTSAY
ncbi:MAG: FKBP-type peptidyl-prolyl cis-trans isomerase [Microbacter sp.]